ncbi:MAG: HAD family phosphatase [Coriobacteriia bacterium]|nr:HAD family phosphatase [Coriobacteriia bacterium]
MAHFPELEKLGCPRAHFEAVIFDFDGTLADSMGVWTDIDWLFCKKYNLGVPDDFRENIIGLGFEGTAEYFINELHVDMTVQECCDEFNRLALERYQHDVRLKPGAKEYLDLLDARGVPFTLASSLNRMLLEAALESNGIAGRFARINLCDELGTHKNQPYIYLTTAAQLGVAPQDCVVFEDIVPATLSAQRVGMCTVGVLDPTDGAQDTPALQKLADVSIHSYHELLA